MSAGIPAWKRSVWTAAVASAAVLLTVALNACGVASRASRSAAWSLPSLPADETNIHLNRHLMLESIMVLMATPYVYAGNDDAGMDCSGFVTSVYRSSTSQHLPRSVREQYAAGAPVENGRLLFGDLVFFNLEGDGPSHVGIYIGDGLFAHASQSRGVTVSLLASEYYHRHYLGARRIAG